MLRCDFLQKDDCHSWMLFFQRNRVYRHLRTAPFQRGGLRGFWGRYWLRLLPSNYWLDLVSKWMLLLRFFFLKFDIDFFGPELHKGNITKLMNIVHRRCSFQLHCFLFDRYEFIIFINEILTLKFKIFKLLNFFCYIEVWTLDFRSEEFCEIIWEKGGVGVFYS